MDMITDGSLSPTDIPQRLISVCDIQDDSNQHLDSSERDDHMLVILKRFHKRMLFSHHRFMAGLSRLIGDMTPDRELRTETLKTYLSEASKTHIPIDWPLAHSTKRLSYVSDGKPRENLSPKPQPNLHKEVLAELQQQIRNNADRSLLNAQVADSLNLPANYCDFIRLASNASNPQPDTRCAAFGIAHGVEHVESSYCLPRRELREMIPSNLHITAGWCAGAEKDCNIVCVLSKRWGEEHESWRWRIVASYAGSGCEENVWIFESWEEFLDWYSDWYARVEWEGVAKNVKDVYWRCTDEAGGQNDSGYGEESESESEKEEGDGDLESEVGREQ